jgi:hypothetical protein
VSLDPISIGSSEILNAHEAILLTVILRSAVTIEFL